MIVLYLNLNIIIDEIEAKLKLYQDKYIGSIETEALYRNMFLYGRITPFCFIHTLKVCFLLQKLITKV